MPTASFRLLRAFQSSSMVEQSAVNRWVEGSSPSSGAIVSSSAIFFFRDFILFDIPLVFVVFEAPENEFPQCTFGFQKSPSKHWVALLS